MLRVLSEEKAAKGNGRKGRNDPPTLAAGEAGQGLQVSRETLRQWMTEAELRRARPKRVRRVHVWRERRAAFRRGSIEPRAIRKRGIQFGVSHRH